MLLVNNTGLGIEALQEVRQHSHWKQFDERTLEGRRSHIMDEYEKLKLLDDRKGSVLIVGAGFIGVEWAPLER